jgi:hypothetical protein
MLPVSLRLDQCRKIAYHLSLAHWVVEALE